MVIADASVAPHHAELVVTEDGRLHLTDCASASGTWREVAPKEGEAGAGWQAVRQAFVRPEEALRLGDHRCTARELLREATARAGGTASGQELPGEGGGGRAARLRGRLERDPRTGEIVRRRP